MPAGLTGATDRPIEGVNTSMLTVSQALNLPVFSEARLVAGQAGLGRQINWVHIVDMPDAQYEYDRSGVLLLTVGYGLNEEADRQAALIPKLVDEGFAGMVLSAGYYLNETPTVIKEQANKLDFPIIELPQEVLFIEVTETILAHIVNEQYALLQASQEIHKQLTQMVLRGGGLGELIKRLAQILKRSVSMENPSFQVLATAHYGPIDEARRRTVAHGRTTPEVARRLLQSGIYDKLAEGLEPITVPPMPDLDMTYERFVVPVVVDKQIFAYMWFISGDQPLTDLELLVVNHGATVAALIMLKEEAVREVEEAQRGDFLEMLLRGKEFTAEFAEQARRLRFKPRGQPPGFCDQCPSGSGRPQHLAAH